MDSFDFCSNQFDSAFVPSPDCLAPDLETMLAVSHISQGMDPLQAALESQLEAPLIEPFLF